MLKQIVLALLLFAFYIFNFQLYGISQIDAMQLGLKLIAPTPTPEKYHDDLIHPCVRYVPNGFAGHKWWMVATPYYGYNYLIENPILFYGDSQDDKSPPVLWTPSAVVEDTPLKGFNSDPCIYFDDKNGMWVFWRAWKTPECEKNKCKVATLGVYTLDGKNFEHRKIFATEQSDSIDHEMCPIVVDVGGKLRLYGCHHTFIPKRLPLGLSIWDIKDNDLSNNVFVKTKDVVPKYKDGFDFWHFDIFQYNDKYYCVVSPEIANQILLGVSDDGENFTFWDMPLLSQVGTNRTYFYKPSAMVKDGIFYLWCPVAEEGTKVNTSRIWMSQINFENLLRILNKMPEENNNNNKISFNIVSDGVVLTNLVQDAKVKIFELTGKLVYEHILSIGTYRIQLSKGIYCIQYNQSINKFIIY